uniref:Uncharacterized protein n=1 Tax=Alexandrium monilatum TaxID=311494 RepID=A0A7S4S855_9DINO
MPVFEQKLINPLAMRFTQEHIRTTFRDGRLLEVSFSEIKSKPGTGDYDILLEAPFPNIEIIRWHPPRHSKDRREGDHWFTLDNRRLYCLQRAAVAHWPLRVAVVVDLLYADPGSVWRKFDSSTCGRSVTIGHSTRGPVLARWDWRSQAPTTCAGAATALEAIAVDDLRGEVAVLQDAPEEPSSLLALALSGALGVLPEPAKAAQTREPGCATPSTVDSSEDSEAVEQVAPPAVEEVLHVLEKQLGGGAAREGEQALEAEAIAEAEWQLRTPGNKGFVWVANWNTRYIRRLGTLRSFLESHPERFVVHPGQGRGYKVSLADASEEQKEEEKQTRKAAPAPSTWRKTGRGAAPQKKWVPAGGA